MNIPTPRLALGYLICAATVAASATTTAAHPPVEPPQEPGGTVWAGVYTEEQAKRGAAVFEQRCSNCHGSDLQGGDDPNGPPLRGRVFTYRWRTRTVGDLFTTIVQNMPANDPGTVSPGDAADLASFILKSNVMPAGVTALPPDVATLNRILMPERPATR